MWIQVFPCIRGLQKQTNKKKVGGGEGRGREELFTSLNKPSHLLLVCIDLKGWNDQEETNLSLSQVTKVPGPVLGMKHRKQTTLQSNSLFVVMKQSHSAHVTREVNFDRELHTVAAYMLFKIISF